MATIFYFTGTGNSLVTARKIGSELNADLVSMRDALKSLENFDDDFIGFAAPVYHGDLPDMVIRFLENVKLAPNAYVFALLTCGGMEGQSLRHIQHILKKRGLALHYGSTLVLPDNYLFTGTSPKRRERFFSRYPQALSEVISDLKERKFNRGDFDKKYNQLPSDISKKAFNLIFNVNDKRIDIDKCNHCGICEKVCPADNIELLEGNYSIGGNCEDCMACAQWCPKKAVYYGKRNASGKLAYTHPGINLSDMLKQKTVAIEEVPQAII